MTDQTLWKREDLAKRWACTTQHVANLCEHRGLPHIRLGRLYRFRPEDVVAWEAAQVKKSEVA